MKHSVQDHYRAPGLTERLEAALSATGLDPANVDIDQLAPFDEFHLRGPHATAELIELLQATPDMHVLDAGAGLGGPARRLARTSGCRVTGIDLSDDYCAAGDALNRWTRLEQHVRLIPGDASDLSRFPDHTFDAAWTIHAAMNIPDKTRFYAEIARVLRPGARFLIYDVLATGAGDIHYPVPWSSGPGGSFLQTQAELLEALRHAGFHETQLLERTAQSLEFLRRAQAQGAPPLGLHLLFGPIFEEMLANLSRNLAEGRLAVTVARTTRSIWGRPE